MTDNISLQFSRASDLVGLPAVVIAKYYEGAKISGTVVDNEGDPLKDITVVVGDDFKQTLELSFSGQTYKRTIEKTPHDFNTTDEDGKFSVIAPEGEITLSFISGGVLIEEIIFNGTGELSPISEEEATRDVGWKRDIGTITIRKGDITGLVFYDKDGDNIYNSSVDSPVSAKVIIGDKEIQTSSNGRYSLENLLPSSYEVTAIKTNYDAARASVAIRPQKVTWHNISLVPSKTSVSGEVWIDQDENGKHEDNESIVGANLQINVLETIDDTENARATSTTSGANGSYLLQLYPGTYTLNVTYSQLIGNETISYEYNEIIIIKIGTGPKTKDIKLIKI